MAIITLTTDFGTADWFVGSVKGVILGINPQVSIVDITHDVPVSDIRAGAFALLASYRCFPRHTVHLAVVDPGVGSNRMPIVVRTADYFFVGPDNGVLSFALAQEKVLEVRRLDNDAYFYHAPSVIHKPVSNTFHGRDIFAPVAARLTQNVPFDSLGEKLNDYVRLDWPQPRLGGAAGGVLRGEIIYIDRFGNAITNLDEAMVRQIGRTDVPPVKQDGRAGKTGGTPVLLLKGHPLCELKRFYQDAPAGQPLALVGSSGFLEIAVNNGNAAQELGLRVGDRVQVRV
ncbi:MAG: SAM-dependent chlorinase/fluorinase [Verrucomicrobiia bacterium]